LAKSILWVMPIFQGQLHCFGSFIAVASIPKPDQLSINIQNRYKFFRGALVK